MTTPKQIDNVVGIDRMDSIDRAKLDPRIKLQLLMAEAKVTHGRDPRSGGMSIVGRPRVILQLMIDMGAFALSSELRLQRPIVIGWKDGEADIIGWWQDVPVVVRSTTIGDNLWVVPNDKIPESKTIDRRRAGELRVNGHAGTLERLKDQED